MDSTSLVTLAQNIEACALSGSGIDYFGMASTAHNVKLPLKDTTYTVHCDFGMSTGYPTSGVRFQIVAAGQSPSHGKTIYVKNVLGHPQETVRKGLADGVRVLASTPQLSMHSVEL